MQSFSYTLIYLSIQKALDQFPDGRYEVRNEVSYFFLIHSDSQRFQLIIKLLCLLRQLVWINIQLAQLQKQIYDLGYLLICQSNSHLLSCLTHQIC